MLNLLRRKETTCSIFVLIYFRDATLHRLFISGKLFYMFRVVASPIIRSTHNCIYSIWYLLTITAICLYCGIVGAGLSVVWELYRSLTYIKDRYNSHTTLKPAPTIPQYRQIAGMVNKYQIL